MPMLAAAAMAALSAAEWLATGVGHARRGDYAAAEPAFAEACRLDPALPDACFYLGRARYFQDRFEEALSPLRQSLASDRTQPPGRAQTAIAQCLEALGRAADAETAFSQAIAAGPRSAEARAKYGLFLLRQGRAADAVTPLEAAVRFDPASAEAALSLGRALFQLERLEAALPHLNRAVKLDPQSAQGHTLLAKAYRRLGRHADAERHLALLRALPHP